MKSLYCGEVCKASLLKVGAVLIVLLLAQFASAQATNWQDIPIGKLPPFHPAEPRRIQLANGMVIFLQ
jgi:hypothetical protein